MHVRLPTSRRCRFVSVCFVNPAGQPIKRAYARCAPARPPGHSMKLWRLVPRAEHEKAEKESEGGCLTLCSVLTSKRAEMGRAAAARHSWITHSPHLLRTFRTQQQVAVLLRPTDGRSLGRSVGLPAFVASPSFVRLPQLGWRARRAGWWMDRWE